MIYARMLRNKFLIHGNPSNIFFVLFRKKLFWTLLLFRNISILKPPNGNRKLLSYKTLSWSKRLTILCLVIESWIGKELSLLKYCVWWLIWNFNFSCRTKNFLFGVRWDTKSRDKSTGFDFVFLANPCQNQEQLNWFVFLIIITTQI